MKEKWLFICLLSLIVLCCEEQRYRKGESDTTECFEVSVEGVMCAHAVLKILDPRFYHLGETTKMFAHSFLANLPCPGSTTDAKLAQSRFFVRISTEPFPDEKYDCVQCLALPVYDGVKQYHVKFVSDCGQGPTD